MANTANPILVLLALLGVQLCFGANYVISKIVVANFPPLVWASLRMTIATIFMWAICLASGRKMPKLDREFLVPMIGLALMGTILNQASFLVGLSLTTSTNAAVLNTLIPIATLALVTLRGQEKLTWSRGIGFALAFGGVLAIRKFEDIRFTDQTFVGDLLNIFNCFLYACFLSFGKPFMEKYDSLWVTAWLFLYGTFGLGIIAIPHYLTFSWPAYSSELALSAVFAILFGTLTPYFLNFWALRHAKPSQVALFIYFQPIIAAFIAWEWYGEKITVRTVVSTLLIFSGLIFALRLKKEKA